MIWIEVAEKLPECGKKVIAYYENANGKPRRIMAYHADTNSIESDSEDNYEAYEYNEEKDAYFLREGWYENNEFDDINWMVDGKITHWMPLPAPPAKLRVRLLISQDDEKLPVGSEGTIIDGTMKKPGMVRVLWDNGMNIPMYRNELEVESI